MPIGDADSTVAGAIFGAVKELLAKEGLVDI
jgi:hypothetical protein